MGINDKKINGDGTHTPAEDVLAGLDFAKKPTVSLRPYENSATRPANASSLAETSHSTWFPPEFLRYTYANPVSPYPIDIGKLELGKINPHSIHFYSRHVYSTNCHKSTGPIQATKRRVGRGELNITSLLNGRQFPPFGTFCLFSLLCSWAEVIVSAFVILLQSPLPF